MNKYSYIYVIKTNYGYGWEDECWYDSKETTLQQVKQDAREYALIANGVRIVKRRVLNKQSLSVRVRGSQVVQAHTRNELT